MATVSIDGVDYEVYADLATADAYMNAQFGAEADAWRAAEPDDQSRGLVTATREIDRQSWLGEKTDEDQELDFPRTGLVYPDGTEVPSDAYPPEVIEATILLAAIVLTGTAAQNEANVASGTRRLKAGSVEIEYFRTFTGAYGAAIFPRSIMALLGQWLAGGVGSIAGSESTGTCGKSAFRAPQYKPSRGF